MIYDLYFHNDFDGRAAAAIMLDFLRTRGDDIEHFVPVGYEMTEQWLKENFFKRHKLFRGKRNPAIVVDFAFHPGAAWWFDHHPTTFKSEVWKKRFKPDAQHQYDPKYASCCGQVTAVLKKDFGWRPSAHFKELVHWGDILDAARYASARQVVELGDIGIQLDAFIDRYPKSARTGKRLVELMAEKPISFIARLPDVRRAVAAIRKSRAASLAYHRKHLKITGRTGYIDLTQSASGKNRYACYYLYPNLLYAVRILRKGKFFQLSVGQNPWRRKENRIDIGEVMKKYGGGGHFGVGATEIPKKKDAEKYAHEIVSYLEEHRKKHGHKIKK